jgi:hypothetical protein
MEGECVPGAAVLKRWFAATSKLQGHKKCRSPVLGNACAPCKPGHCFYPSIAG